MNCHIVPQVYLRSWKIPEFKKSLYLFNKNDIASNGLQANIKNLSNTDFTAVDKYLLKIEDHSYINELNQEYIQLFDKIKHYKISFEGTPIINVNDFISNLPNINQWKISDLDNNHLNPEQIKILLQEIWKEKVEKLIESYFDHNIENNWHLLLNYINNILLFK